LKRLDPEFYRETVQPHENALLHPIQFVDASAWARQPEAPSDPILYDFLDAGDKAMLIAPSKARKSFYLLEAAVGLAAGVPVLGFKVPKARRVAVANLEIQGRHYHRRLRRMTEAMGLDPTAYAGRLFVANLRGHVEVTLERIGQALSDFRPELVVVDPLYKLYGAGHDENSAGDGAALLRQFDTLLEKLGCATLTSHHDRKSAGGDSRATDRGSGTGLLARDYDAAVVLTPHATEPDALVVEYVCRNYPPRDDACLRWTDGRFVVDAGLAAIPETAATRKARRGRGQEDAVEKVAGWLAADGPVLALDLYERIRRTFGLGEKATRNLANDAMEEAYERVRDPVSGRYWIRPRGGS
jgi:hypothetical protein